MNNPQSNQNDPESTEALYSAQVIELVNDQGTQWFTFLRPDGMTMTMNVEPWGWGILVKGTDGEGCEIGMSAQGYVLALNMVSDDTECTCDHTDGDEESC